MPVLEEVLLPYLDAAIPAVGARFFAVTLPEQAPLPAITLQTISDPAQAVLSGVTADRKARLQFSIFSQSGDDCVLLAEELRDALHACRASAAGLEITSTIVVDGGDLPSTDDVPALFARTLDAMITYRRS